MRNFKAFITLNVPQKCSVKYYTNAEMLKTSKKIVQSVEYSPRPKIETFTVSIFLCFISNLMNYYVYNYNHDEQDIFAKIARYHIDFERIHPFEDGNGRTGRLLINYELLKNNLPPVVISKDDRIKYFEFLRNNDGTGLAQWPRDLSYTEEERMKKFGYKN